MTGFRNMIMMFINQAVQYLHPPPCKCSLKGVNLYLMLGERQCPSAFIILKKPQEMCEELGRVSCTSWQTTIWSSGCCTRTCSARSEHACDHQHPEKNTTQNHTNGALVLHCRQNNKCRDFSHLKPVQHRAKRRRKADGSNKNTMNQRWHDSSSPVSTNALSCAMISCRCSVACLCHLRPHGRASFVTSGASAQAARTRS